MNLSVTLWPQDAAILMGADRRKSTYTLWAEKRGSVPVHRLREPDQRRQLPLAERFGKRTGLEPEPDIGEYTRGFLFAEGHWKIRGKSAGLTCIPGDPGPLRRIQGQLYPVRHYFQCLHRLLVTGWECWYLAVQPRGEEEPQIYEIPACREELLSLDLAENQFYYRVQQGPPPVGDGSFSTTRTLERLYGKTLEETVDLTPIARTVQNYLRWREWELECRQAVKICANSIREFLGPAAHGQWEDLTVTWAPPADHPTAPRRFRIQKSRRGGS